MQVKDRERAKRCAYATIYGVGHAALAVQLAVPTFEARRLHDNFLAEFPGIKTFQDKVTGLIRQQGYCETLAKRRRYFEDVSGQFFLTRLISVDKSTVPTGGLQLCTSRKRCRHLQRINDSSGRFYQRAMS